MTTRRYWTTNGTGTTDGGDVDITIPAMRNRYIPNFYQVRLRYTDSPDPATGTFTIYGKVLDDTEFQSIGTIDMSSNNIYTFSGLMSEVRISPPANSPANNYAYYLAASAN